MEYHNHKFQDYSLLVFKNKKLVAVLPANKLDNVVYSHQGLTYGGLVILKTLKIQSIIQVFKAVLKYLQEQQIQDLHLKVMPAIYNQFPNEELEYLLFILNAKITRRDLLSVIDLQATNTISKNRLEGCKKAKKQGLIIKEEEDLDHFWKSILIPNLQEKFKVNPVHNLEEINLLKKRFKNNIRQFNVYQNHKLVGGTTIFETKKVAHVQYISANNEKNKLGTLDFLFTHLIQTEFANKPYFDFGISNENNGKNINQGLQFWKEGFGATGIVQDFYHIKTNNFSALDTILI